MRLLPRSIFARLLALATLTTALALAFAAFSIGHVLERFIRHGLDEQLDAQAAILVKAVRPDGSIDVDRIVNLPAFEDGRGWGWRIAGPRGELDNGVELPPPPPEPPIGARRGQPGDRPDHARRGEHGAAHGTIETRVVPTAAGDVTIVAAGPPRLAFAALREALLPLFLSLALLGAGLAAAALIQLRLGLLPLGRLRVALGEVRAGRRRRIPEDQPAELAPLAAELNALIDQNEAGLENARRHVANLAHGIKTPLAALAIRLGENGGDADGGLRATIAEIDARVRHHLGRARSAAPGVGRLARTALAPAIEDLVAVLRKIHADRAVDASLRVAGGIAIAIDPQDLDELLGNLLDNAWRHAARRIRIDAEARDGTATIGIEDDGPGLDADALREALLPGRRLDERGEGHGFGLSISEELAELNGGSLLLARSEALGGLCARVALPLAHNPAPDESE